MTKEIWKDIKGFEGLYQISNYGRVWSCRRGNYKVPDANNFGYLRIQLSVKKKHYRFFIHRLVAETFLPNPENKTQVNHKDCDKTNNYVGNLEWTTPSENMNHAYINGRCTGCFMRKPYKLTYRDGRVQYFTSIVDVAAMVGCSKNALYNALNSRGGRLSTLDAVLSPCESNDHPAKE